VGRTLPEKVWDAHVVRRVEGEPDLLYIDLHLVHEVTSPQAFDGLRLAGRPVRRPDLTLATEDHNVPTDLLIGPIADPVSRKQVETLRRNCEEFGVRLHPMGDAGQGIVHVIGPQLGVTQPGMTIVCGDSHTSTHGAFGALAFGIGTSEVEHVLATQTLPLVRPRTMAVTVEGRLQPGVTAKDLVLALIAQVGTGGGQGPRRRVPRRGDPGAVDGGPDDGLQHEHRVGRAGGMIAPDETTFAYLQGARGARGRRLGRRRRLLAHPADRRRRRFDSRGRASTPPPSPRSSPGGPTPRRACRWARRARPATHAGRAERDAAARALEYMGLQAGTPMRDVAVDTVFLGSCTNGRMEDLRRAAEIVQGRKVADGIRAMVVPGSMLVKLQAEQEGLDEVFRAAGFDWRSAGCSMCLGMNPDTLAPGERSASTSNRNFEGRQGRGGRTHLVSPQVAAATAIVGRLAAPADLQEV
jgi:3-isopropylmalate/(R)-2-methylmalate dehydratase large subunit